jgi:four helix bundle protein
MKEEPIFDHEKLDVYQVELFFIAWVTTLLHEVRDAAEGFHREVCDQLDRSSLSSLLNTAEGNGKRQGKQRAKFFDDARGSAVECAACLDALVAKGLATTERVAEGKALLVRVVGMLTKLVDRFDAYRAREGEEDDDELSPPSLSIPFRPRPSSSLTNQIENEGRERERGRKR